MAGPQTKRTDERPLREVSKEHDMKETTVGSVTLPAEAGHEETVLALVRKWGADAIRDSDGTCLSDDLLKLGLDIYSTLCVVRADQEYARSHWGQLARKFFMSEPATATSQTVKIKLMSGFCSDKYQVDAESTPKKYWEVIDRTTGAVVPAGHWEYDPAEGTVTVRNAAKFHVYTVNFMVLQTWVDFGTFSPVTRQRQGRCRRRRLFRVSLPAAKTTG